VAKDFAICGFAKDLLSTVDVLALAIKSVPEELRVPPPSSSSESSETPSHPNPRLYELFQGVQITERQLLQTLSPHGVTPYDPLGEAFDPNKHEALFSVPVCPKGDNH
jgi:molecular chaperone GrpE